MELSKMADEVTRLQLAQQKAGKSVDAVKVASGPKETEKLSSGTTTDIYTTYNQGRNQVCFDRTGQAGWR